VDAQRRTGGTCRALAMRDTDRDRVTHVLVRADGPVRTLTDLRGRTIAVGASDSAQATLLPLHHLHTRGLVAGTLAKGGSGVNVLRHDVLVGKHGDHVGGERDALQALLDGRADAAAVLDLNCQLWSRDGKADPARVRVLETTAPFDHCNFTASDRFAASLIERWTQVLLSMDYANPAHREMMDMEGLKRWLPGRTIGYAALEAAVDEQAFFEAAAR
jgi:ABC-type phosphate/phosphonate transport system substrate-binding protein